MKKIRFTLAIMALVLCSLTVNAQHYTFEVDGIAYNLASDTYTAEVTKASKLYESDIVIPDTVIYKEEAYNVTSIGRTAFFGCTRLTSITIPESMKSIGGGAFYGCSSLTSITIPENVTSIGDHAFCSCSNLTSITIPENVTSIGANAFMLCKLDTIVVADENTVYDSRNDCNAIIETKTNTLIAGCATTTIPKNITRIEDNAFYGYTGLISITIPDGVTSIGDWSFFNCGLASVSLPESVTSIGANSFSHCNKLTSINIPKGVTSIEDNTFSNCSILTSISLPESLMSIGTSAFSTCNLTSIEIPESVTDIGEWALASCSSLTSVSLPENLTNIGKGVFSGCSSLTSIAIPKSVTTIGEKAFADCSCLTSITIPENVDSIGNYAFRRCTSFTSITIPQSVTSIGEGAFSSCNNITAMTVAEDNPIFDSRNNCHAIIETNNNTLIAGCSTTKIPESVTRIGREAFYTCENLTTITIPEGVTSIGDQAFYSCRNLTTVFLPASLTEIGMNIFGQCEKIQDIYCYAENAPMCPTALGPTLKQTTLHVPANALGAYKSTYPWNLFGNIAILDDESKTYLVTEGKEWAIARSWKDEQLEATTIYRLQGDTMINGKTYKQTWIRASESSPMQQWPHFMREENGKVYISKGGDSENLWFDYTAQVGDTLCFGNGYGKISSIDHVPWPMSTSSKLCMRHKVQLGAINDTLEKISFGEEYIYVYEGIGVLNSENYGYGLGGHILTTQSSQTNVRLLYVYDNDRLLYMAEEPEPSRPTTKRGYGIYHGDTYLYRYTIDESKEVTDSTDFARWYDKTVIYFDVDTIGPNAFSGATFRQGQILYFTERLNTIFKDAFTDINIIKRTSQESLMSDDLTLVFAGANPPGIDKNHIMDYADSTYHINYVVPDLAAYIEDDIQWTYTTLMTIDDFVQGYISPENEVTVNDSTETNVSLQPGTNQDGNIDLVVHARPRKEIPVRIGEGENKDIYSRAPAWMRYTMELRITDSEGTELYAGEMQCSAYGECQFNVSFACPTNNIIHIYSRSIDMFGRATEWAITTINLDTSISPTVAPNTDTPYYDLQGRPVAHPTRGMYIRNGRKVIL